MISNWLEYQLNAALKRGGGAAPLARFAGKTLAISLLPLQLTLLVNASGDGLTISSQRGLDAPNVSCQLRVDGRALPLLRDPQQLGPLLASGAIALNGDAEFAADLLRTLRQQGLNGEELLAGVVGDPLAHIFAGGLRRLAQPPANGHLPEQIGRLLRDELQWLVSQHEAAPQFSAISAVQQRVDAASQRLEQLLQQGRA